MAGCTICGAEPAHIPAYTKRLYCKEHFWTLIEKRVRKDIRLFQPLEVKEPYVFEDDGSPLTDVTKQLLDRIFQGRLVYSPDAILTIQPHCLEQDVSERFSLFLEKKPLLIDAIRPLRTVSVNDINFLLGTSLAGFGHPLLQNLERKQPGTFFSMSKLLKEKE